MKIGQNRGISDICGLEDAIKPLKINDLYLRLFSILLNRFTGRVRNKKSDKPILKIFQKSLSNGNKLFAIIVLFLK